MGNSLDLSFFKKDVCMYVFIYERELEWREGKRKKENLQAASPLSTEPHVGLHPMTWGHDLSQAKGLRLNWLSDLDLSLFNYLSLHEMIKMLGWEFGSGFIVSEIIISFLLRWLDRCGSTTAESAWHDHPDFWQIRIYLPRLFSVILS